MVSKENPDMYDGGSNPMDAALRALGEALQAADGPPPELVASAKAIFTWRTIDAELAALTFDSVVDGELAGVRGAAAARSLTFETPSVVLDVEITGEGDLVDLVGSVMPATGATLALQHADGARRDVAVDDLGRFRLDGLATGTVRFVVTAGEGTQVVTDWFGL
jgi:hypothetical protein